MPKTITTSSSVVSAVQNVVPTSSPAPAVAVVQAACPQESLEGFKRGVDALLAKREYFIAQVLPSLKPGQDFYEIKGRKSLAKGGAEKLASIYTLIATFQQDTEVRVMLPDVKNMVAFICSLLRNGEVVGQGRGADTLARNQNDPNKTIKMAQKRAFIDAVIRTTGLSDLFTQDLEDMVEDTYVAAPMSEIEFKHAVELDNSQAPIRAVQLDTIRKLCIEKKYSDAVLATGLITYFKKKSISELTIVEADDLIQRLQKKS